MTLCGIEILGLQNLSLDALLGKNEAKVVSEETFRHYKSCSGIIN